MTETYLHFIWKLKRLPLHQLTTTDGKAIQIINNGIHNTSESGPDFFNARIRFDGMEWVGQIELHVKSSDWIKHNHGTNAAYNNVILHVVYEHDQEIAINHAPLPTLELKNLIDLTHFMNWNRLASAIKEIPCQDQLLEVDRIYLNSMMYRAVVDRLNRKINQLLYTKDQQDNQSALYYLISQAFGTKINALPFEMIANQLPLSLLKRLHPSMQKKLVMHTSGLFSSEPIAGDALPFNMQTIEPSVWKRKGLRPVSFPERRIEQFAVFVAICNFELLAEYLRPKEAHSYVLKLVHELNQYLRHSMSEQLTNQLFINAILPYYWYKSCCDDNKRLQEFVLDFYEEIQSENNYIIKKWKHVGVVPKNAFESQALIELYNEYCSRKKCLSCQVGTKILGN